MTTLKHVSIWYPYQKQNIAFPDKVVNLSKEMSIKELQILISKEINNILPANKILIYKMEGYRDKYMFDNLKPFINSEIPRTLFYCVADTNPMNLIKIDEQKNVSDDDLKCPICLDNYIATYLNCGHNFCYVCVYSLKNKDCPLCRKKFTNTNTVDILGHHTNKID